MLDPNWEGKISNSAQLGGIETSVIDNGPARGTRIAWINTGAGLRFKLVLDRAMDIADAFFNQHSIAWLSHVGVTAPQPFSNMGLDWLKTFGGGLLTTCGLSHVGGPEEDEFGQRGIHGQISNLSAEIESIIQPDPVAGKFDMSVTGKMKETQALGPNLELKRTISATLGEASIRIHDEVLNRGNMPAPHMLLYHFNFGWPLVDEGTDIIWNGEWQPREGNKNEIFKEGSDYHKCSAPLEEHNGRGEEVAMIDIATDPSGWCKCGLYNRHLNLAISLRFKKEQLPWLINWQHWGRGEYVTGLEPATNQLIGQSKARERGELIFLQPGERRTYDLEIDLFDRQDQIDLFLKK
ncbi:MAG TPA: aldose 1-epimerase family protein [Segetibacter sp.]|nr:aldose 1-epimerase family protein [Segetibacter sp.]